MDKKEELSREIFYADVARSATKIDFHHKQIDEIIEIIGPYIDDAYNKGIRVLGIIHGNCTDNKRHKLVGYFRGNDKVEHVSYIPQNFGRLYVLVKRK